MATVEVEISRPPCPHPREPVLLEGNGTMPMLFRSMIERWWPRSKKSVPPDLKSPATRSRADRFRLKRWNWSPIRQDYSLRTASPRLAVWHPGMPIILNWPWSRFARDSQNHWYTALSLFPYILLIFALRRFFYLNFNICWWRVTQIASYIAANSFLSRDNFLLDPVIHYIGLHNSLQNDLEQL